MDYKEEIEKTIRTADEEQLKVIYQFILSVFRRKAK